MNQGPFNNPPPGPFTPGQGSPGQPHPGSPAQPGSFGKPTPFGQQPASHGYGAPSGGSSNKTLWMVLGGIGCLGLCLFSGVALLFAAGVYQGVNETLEVAETLEQELNLQELERQQALDEILREPILAGGGPAGEIVRYRVPMEPTQAYRGADAPLVTLVVFSEFQCPFCARLAPVLSQVESQYAGDVRIVFRHNPLPMHSDAMPAANAALEVHSQLGNAGFWRMHDELFANQRALSTADLVRYAGAVGADGGRVRAAIAAETHGSTIRRDQALATSLGATGTPTTFVNGRKLSGALPLTRFQEVIDEELRNARRLVASGTPRAAVYDTLIRDGATSPVAEADAPTPTPSRPQPDPATNYRVPVGTSPVQGPADALVTVVAFSDFECPFCSRVVPTLAQIRTNFPADVRIVFKHNPLPFHSNAEAAAILSIEAQQQQGDAGFFAMHDLLFENTRSLDRASLERYARQRGLDLARVRSALDGNTHSARIDEDQELAQRIGARGTPTFFVNGRPLRGAQPYEAFRVLIEDERRAASARVAAGTPRAEAYEALMRTARPAL